MTTCSESGQVRKEAAIRSLCRASGSIERTGFLFARFYQTAQCSTLRATQSDNLSFKRQGMTRRSMPCLFHANLFALGGARWLCQNIDGYAVQEAAKCLVSRWSSALPAGSLDYQTPRRRPGPVVQKSPVKARLSNLIYPLRNAACWFCLGIDGYVVQEAAVLLLAFLQLKRPVSLGWGNEPLFVSGLVDWQRQ